MDITWFGQSCFRIKGKTTTVVIDPFKPDFVGLKLGKMTADAVLITHSHEDHNFPEIVEGDPVIIAGPGEYEVKGVTISGIQTFHDEQEGAQRGKNTVYLLEIDGVTIVHLGDIGKVLSKEQVSAIGSCDILMVPVGGVYTIEADKAQEIVTQLEPAIVLPMHYKIEGLKFDLDPLAKFLKEAGAESVEPQPKLTISKDKLPEDTQVVVLQKQ